MADDEQGQDSNQPRAVLVLGPDGQPMAVLPGGTDRGTPVGRGAVDAAGSGGDTGGADGGGADGAEDPSRMIEQPAKVMRIGSMIKQLLEEVRAAPLDDAGRQLLKEIHRRSIRELEDGLAPELRDELARLTLPFTESTPSEPELRIAQAQLVGWLEGLFHGIQAALMAQQMAARLQLEQMRTGRPALPPGMPGMPGAPGMPGHPGGPAEGPTGQYL